MLKHAAFFCLQQIDRGEKIKKQKVSVGTNGLSGKAD